MHARRPHDSSFRTRLLTRLIPVFAFLAATMVIPGSATAQDDDDQLRKEVLRSIELAQAYLFKQQNADGSWDYQGSSSTYRQGATGLVIVALINSGLPPEHPNVAKGLDYLRKVDPSPVTYEAALSIMAFAAAKKDARDMERMRQLTEFLVKNQSRSGGWSYGRILGGFIQIQDTAFDNSNTQYAVLGLRDAALAGVDIPQKVWKDNQRHWISMQSGSREARNGSGWGYGNERTSYGSMTVAGIASLIIASSFLDDDEDLRRGELNCCGNNEVDDAEKAIQAGIRWLAASFSVKSNPRRGGWVLYYLYGLERAGRLSGRRFFGDHDWYREGVRFLLTQQSKNTGHWSSGAGGAGGTSETAFGLLFVSKGLAPVLINKLEFGPRNPQTGEVADNDWNRHTHDVRNLVDYVSTLEKWPKLITWQILDLEKAAKDGGVADLLQAPIQYMNGSERPDRMTAKETQLLREYITQGGFLLAVQNCESAEFDQGFRDLIQRMFPGGNYSLQKLPPTHDIYRSEEVFANNPPELWGVDFGCRTAIVYAPYDHACRWHHWSRGASDRRPVAVKTSILRSMRLGVNIVAYATGRELFNKLDRPDALPTDDDGRLNRGYLSVARLRHTGGWDSAPHALRHLLASLSKVGINPSPISPNLPATDESLSDHPLLYMHGRKNFNYSDAERENLKEYLENGGVLFADACCGSKQFDRSFREMIEQTFGRKLERIPMDHELFDPKWGYDIRMVRRREPTSDVATSVVGAQEKRGEPFLEGIEIDGRYAVIYSKYDISCALERQATVTCDGYVTEDAVRIASTIVKYALLQDFTGEVGQ